MESATWIDFLLVNGAPNSVQYSRAETHRLPTTMNRSIPSLSATMHPGIHAVPRAAGEKTMFFSRRPAVFALFAALTVAALVRADDPAPMLPQVFDKIVPESVNDLKEI